MGELVKFGDVM